LQEGETQVSKKTAVVGGLERRPDGLSQNSSRDERDVGDRGGGGGGCGAMFQVSKALVAHGRISVVVDRWVEQRS